MYSALAFNMDCEQHIDYNIIFSRLKIKLWSPKALSCWSIKDINIFYKKNK